MALTAMNEKPDDKQVDLLVLWTQTTIREGGWYRWLLVSTLSSLQRMAGLAGSPTIPPMNAPDLDEAAMSERGLDSAEVREFWQAVARKAAFQEIMATGLLIVMFSVAGLAMVTGVITWIRWLMSAFFDGQ
jgi:hypothetical protein